ncbi:MAG: gliding motility protein GldL [Saprospiraceae bacterium]
MALVHSNNFKYFKNFIIGVGASIVLVGALGKIQSYEWGGWMLTVGLSVEAFIFLFLAVIPPERDYYWDKLYPGLDDYTANVTALTAGPAIGGSTPLRAVDGEALDRNMGGMLSELQVMSKSLSSLKALQEVDFSKTQDHIKGMGNFYEKMNEAIASMADSIEDTKHYKEQVIALNQNLGALNAVYGNVLSAMNGGNRQA